MFFSISFAAITSASLQTFALTLLNLVSTIALVLLAYYALRIYFHMRQGRLERGWKFLSQGIIFMSLGFLSISIEHTFSRDSLLYFYLDSIGAVLSLVGIVLMLIGLHSHYTVWYRKLRSSGDKVKDKENIVEDGDV